jgi:uncharacterized protein YcbX
MTYIISELNIFPVKSLAGISLQNAEVTERGFKYDRRFLLVDADSTFLTQRTYPQMSRLAAEINNEVLIISKKEKPADKVEIPLKIKSGEKLQVKIWEDFIDAISTDNEICNWFSNFMGFECRLVYMPDESERYVDKKFALHGEKVSFADGYPFLIIGQSSLNDLNSRLEIPVPMNRFRPNIVFSGGNAFDEDEWYKFKINNITFYGVKPCSRCVLTTVNQDTAEKGLEPLATLSKYRTVNNEVMFGQNLLHKGAGQISVGDEIIIVSFKEKAR